MMFDAIVVGGGPAGCAAAYDLAREGLTVIILDNKTFPRLKPCAGTLTMRAVNLIRYDIAPVIKEAVYGQLVGLPLHREILMEGPRPLCVTTVRTDLDDFCLNQTRRCGATVETIPGIQAVREDNNSVTLIDDHHRSYRGRYLIGADGVNSQIRKLTGECSSHYRAMAIEGIVPLERCAAKPRMTFNYGAVENGYGWLIPKGDHINVGLYSGRPSAEIIGKLKLQAYVEKRIHTQAVEQIVAFPLGLGGEHYRPGLQRIFLVGDAAGLAEPLWGEGIHNAIKSGQAAASAVAAAITAGKDARLIYQDLLREITHDVQNCRKLATWLYKLPFLIYLLLKTSAVQSALINGFAAGMTMTEIKRHYFPYIP